MGVQLLYKLDIVVLFYLKVIFKEYFLMNLKFKSLVWGMFRIIASIGSGYTLPINLKLSNLNFKFIYWESCPNPFEKNFFLVMFTN